MAAHTKVPGRCTPLSSLEELLSWQPGSRANDEASRSTTVLQQVRYLTATSSCCLHLNCYPSTSRLAPCCRVQTTAAPGCWRATTLQAAMAMTALSMAAATLTNLQSTPGI